MSIDLRSVPGRPTYSLVIPVFNEEQTLLEMGRRLGPVLDRLDAEAEVLLVDDGSRDASWAMIADMHRADPRFKGVRLSRNFGHQAAITAGMDLATGDAIVILDADLQDPPEVILEMAERWREGYEVVYGVRDDRSTDTWFKRTTADLFYRWLNRISDIDIPRHVGDFRLVDRRPLDAFLAMREGARFVRGMWSWVGFRQIGVQYRREVRFAGHTKYPLRKMMRLAGDAVLSFSRVPLRLIVKAGLLVGLLAVLIGCASAGEAAAGVAVADWMPIVAAIGFVGALQIVFLGIIGHYIGRTYEEAISRPLYVVSSLAGAQAPIEAPARAVIAEPASVATLLGEPLPVEPLAADRRRQRI